MARTLDSAGPLTRFSELLLGGSAPDLADFCAQYPEVPDLRLRIEDVIRLRAGLQILANASRSMPGPPWQPPKVVGGFRLLSPLGRGGMGQVFLAQREGDGQACAVKLMRPGRSSLVRFEREAKLAARLEHPGITAVIASGVDDGIAYIATELVHGVPLAGLLNPSVAFGDSPPERYLDAIGRVAGGTLAHSNAVRLGPHCAVIDFVWQVADALGHAHVRGVVHRDVKPSNIMLTFTGAAKVIDFGVALASRGDDTRVTSPGVFVGSPRYAAPEQFEGTHEEIGPWTDVYGLGLVLLEMLVGDDWRDIPGLDAQQAPAAALQRVKDDAVGQVLHKALHREPGKRFPSGEALAKALLGATSLLPQGSSARSGLDPATIVADRPGPPRPGELEEVVAAIGDTVRGWLRGVGDETVLVVACDHRGVIEDRLAVAIAGHDRLGCAVVGRHSRCKPRLSHDPSVSLRHLAIVATLDAGEPLVRIVDLGTAFGFGIPGLSSCRHIAVRGPTAVHVGGSWLLVLPGTHGGEPDASYLDAILRQPRRVSVVQTTGEDQPPPRRSGETEIAVLPPAVEPGEGAEVEPQAGCYSLTIRPGNGGATRRIGVGWNQLDRGVLLGRYRRNDVGRDQVPGGASLSRVHILLLHAGQGVVAMDLASTNGATLNGQPLRIARLRDRAQLSLVGVEIEWRKG